MGAADGRRGQERMERTGHRQMDRSVSLEIENGSCRLKAGKRDGGVTHADDTNVGNATDDRTYNRSPHMCMGGQVKYNRNE